MENKILEKGVIGDGIQEDIGCLEEDRVFQRKKFQCCYWMMGVYVFFSYYLGLFLEEIMSLDKMYYLFYYFIKKFVIQ